MEGWFEVVVSARWQRVQGEFFRGFIYRPVLSFSSSSSSFFWEGGRGEGEGKNARQETFIREIISVSIGYREYTGREHFSTKGLLKKENSSRTARMERTLNYVELR